MNNNKPEHTPGPWKAKFATVTKSDGFKIRMLGPRGAAPEAWAGISANLYADARLVAAAPELLECLQAILEVDDPDKVITANWTAEDWKKAKRQYNEAIRNAITKAII